MFRIKKLRVIIVYLFSSGHCPIDKKGGDDDYDEKSDKAKASHERRNPQEYFSKDFCMG